MQIGKKLYYEIATGNIILDTGERAGSVIETTIEQDFEAYASLAERVPETVGMIQLEFAEHAQDFAECSGYRVDITGETPTLVFSYPDPAHPETPPTYQKPLTEQIAEVKAEKDLLAQQMSQLDGDFFAFQQFYFEKNPEQA